MEISYEITFLKYSEKLQVIYYVYSIAVTIILEGFFYIAQKKDNFV